MRLASCSIGLSCVLLATAAGAEGAAEWDHRHMKSRHRSVLETPMPKVIVGGDDRYEQITNSPGERPGFVPPETLDSFTQRSWTQGSWAITSPTRRAARAKESALSSGLNSGRHGNKPPGARPKAHGESALKRGSTHKRHGRRR